MKNMRKMKNVKSLVITVLCCLSLLVLFHGCGKDGGASPGGKGNFTLNGASS